MSKYRRLNNNLCQRGKKIKCSARTCLCTVPDTASQQTNLVDGLLYTLNLPEKHIVMTLRSFSDFVSVAVKTF
jgi:hypothetical protein